jgi:MFS family permease
VIDIVPDHAARPARFGEVLAVREFRFLWIAHAQSRLGDQLARVAIAILVFDHTGSAALTALTYALTFLPPLVSAPLLVGLADRFSRRRILVLVDGFRALLVALMAVPGFPLVVLVLLLVAVVSLQPLYSSARNAILPNVLSGDRYVVGVGLAQATDSIVQVAGFAFGGVLVGLIGSHGALGVDAVTFACSATLAGVGLSAHRPEREDSEQQTSDATVRQAIGLIFGDARLRSLVMLIWLYGFYIAPEGLAAPYARELGEGSLAVGLLMAADPIGAGLGAVALSRLVRPDLRPRLMGPLAVAAGLPLMVSALAPSLGLSVAMWVLTGALSSHLVIAIALFTRQVPDHRRGQVVGLASAGLATAQGLGIVAAGMLGSVVPPSVAVAVCGGAGSVCAIAAGLAWNRASKPVDAPGQSR